jgi:hypothetical protein
MARRFLLGDALGLYRKDIEEAYQKYAAKKTVPVNVFSLMKNGGILKARSWQPWLMSVFKISNTMMPQTFAVIFISSRLPGDPQVKKWTLKY